MSEITSADIRGVFTKTLIDVYKERHRPTSFLRSFFPVQVSPSKLVSIEVERNGELVATDIYRGTDPNRNTWSHSTEKMFLPPYYSEDFDATQLDLYDRVLGSLATDNSRMFAALMDTIADKVGALQDKIERALEIKCSQVLETGVLSINAGTDIDFKRKAASIVDLGAGQYFANNIDPFKKFEAGCKFLREVGKSGDSTFNAILGETALADLLANTKFTARQDYRAMILDQVSPPQRNATGATYHGTITAGAYRVNLWAYPQVYDTLSSGTLTSTAYVNPKKVYMLPANPRFKMAHAAVPQLINGNVVPMQGQYIVSDYIDERRRAHLFQVEAAAMPIPVAVDQIYTMIAVA